MTDERAQENIELVLSGWLLPVRRGDLQTLEQHLHADVFWQGVHPDYRCTGRRQVLDMLADGLEPPRGVSRVELSGNHEHVVVGVQSDQLERIGEVDVGGQVFLLFTIRDGKIARIDDHLTRSDAFAAAGMSEPPSWR
jgi:ketosteroid isomerase-like protein